VSRAPRPHGTAPSGRPRVEQPAEDGSGGVRVEIDLEAVFAGVAGARDEGVAAEDARRPKAVILEIRRVRIAEGADESGRLRALDRDERVVGGAVRDARARPGARLRPGEVLRSVRSVDDEEVVVLGSAVDEQVVYERPAVRQKRGVLNSPVRELRHVVRGDSLERREGLRPGDLELAHVRDIKETDALANRAMFLENAGVLHRHLPAAEVDQTRAELAVDLVKGGSLERNGLARCGRHAGREISTNGRRVRPREAAVPSAFP
jgi:hypothetical protein